MKFVVAFVLSVALCVAMFFGMHLMTNSNNKNIHDKQKTPHLVFLRENRDSKIERKKRIKPKKEVKKIPKKLKLVKKFNTKPDKAVKIVPFKVQQNIEISKISSLAGAQVLLDANSLAPLKRVNPKYPRRAKLKKKEGFVKLIFDIGQDGYVYNVKIMDSNPAGIFEQNSIKAIKRWKFNKSEYAKSATITFNFRLAK